jgi:hypothetical protein
VEKQLHWSLDVAFREDGSRVREPAARENLAVLRHIALNRLKNDPTKLGIQNKRLTQRVGMNAISPNACSRPRHRQANATHQMPGILALADAIALARAPHLQGSIGSGVALK